MNLELHMIPRLEQDVYLIPEYELSRVLTAASPFKGSVPTKEALLGYLTRVNGALKERREERQALYESYVTAVSLYSCVRPAMHLNIPEKLPQAFTLIARRKPYRVQDPLEVIMKRDEEDAEPMLMESLFEARLVNIDAGVPQSLQEVVTLSEFVKQKLAAGLRDTARSLVHEYTQSAHLLFITLWDICFPLFSMRRTASEYHQLDAHLRHQYGHFCLKVPLHLAPQHEEAA